MVSLVLAWVIVAEDVLVIASFVLLGWWLILCLLTHFHLQGSHIILFACGWYYMPWMTNIGSLVAINILMITAVSCENHCGIC